MKQHKEEVHQPPAVARGRICVKGGVLAVRLRTSAPDMPPIRWMGCIADRQADEDLQRSPSAASTMVALSGR